jgi:hypothetical protein
VTSDWHQKFARDVMYVEESAPNDTRKKARGPALDSTKGHASYGMGSFKVMDAP